MLFKTSSIIARIPMQGCIFIFGVKQITKFIQREDPGTEGEEVTCYRIVSIVFKIATTRTDELYNAPA